jgi:DNA-binding CsgD family transcriptional regulator
MRTSAYRFTALQSLPVSAAILESSGKIVAVNEAWKTFGERNGLMLPEFGVGQDYLHHCGDEVADSDEFKSNLRKLLTGKMDLLTLVYPCHSPEKQRWFFLIGMPLALGKPAGVALVHTNISELLPLPRTELGTVSEGVEEAIGSAVTKQLADMLAPSRDDAVLARLTNRQRDVLRLIGKGKSNKEIARSLGRSDETVKVHVAAILRQLEVKNRTEAALLASKLPLAD